jgi:hypothetical protein
MAGALTFLRVMVMGMIAVGVIMRMAVVVA